MMIRSTMRRVAAVGCVLLAASSARAQTAPLTLTEALRLAAAASETVDIARAGEARADAQIQTARSQRLPQVNFAGAYSRTLASEFSSAFDTSGPPCPALAVDPTRPLADRIAELERAAGCGALGSGFDLSNLPFGQKNIYQTSFSFSQALYAGGRITAQEQQAALSRQLAGLTTSSTQAQVALDVTRAYYDAALSDRLLAIAQSGYDQAAATFDQTRQSFDAGRQPEFELLRAQVARDNQRPLVIRRRADRDIAYLRLRQLLELPADTPLVLDVNLDDATLAPPAPFAEAIGALNTATDTERSDVRQARLLVDLRQAGIRIARAERLPAVSLNSALTPVGYPSSGVFPSFDDFRTNWSVSANVQIPLFNGWRLRAAERSARADLSEAEARLKQTQELTVLDEATARQDLAAAEAVWQASAGTIDQARRAYEIAELRNREGLSTQLELSDSRLSLQVAQANRAQAARDLQVARARVALLPNLPTGAR